MKGTYSLCIEALFEVRYFKGVFLILLLFSIRIFTGGAKVGLRYFLENALDLTYISIFLQNITDPQTFYNVVKYGNL